MFDIHVVGKWKGGANYAYRPAGWYRGKNFKDLSEVLSYFKNYTPSVEKEIREVWEKLIRNVGLNRLELVTVTFRPSYEKPHRLRSISFLFKVPKNFSYDPDFSGLKKLSYKGAFRTTKGGRTTISYRFKVKWR